MSRQVWRTVMRRQHGRLKRRLRPRIVAVCLAAAGITSGAVWLALLRQSPAPREIALGAASILFVILALVGGYSLIEDGVARRTEDRMRRFLADASHELRTPIASIQSSTETLLRTNPRRADRERLLLRVLHDTNRAGRLVEDLLTMTRLDQGIPLAREWFDLVPVIAELVARTRDLAPTITVILDAPERCPLWADPHRIAQAVENLLANARHATPDSGRITVRMSIAPGHVQIDVIDSGAGVPPGDRNRIFDRFARIPGTYVRQPIGNGLGLAIARGIAHAHAGSLDCLEPADHGGAHFAFRLPVPSTRDTRQSWDTATGTGTSPADRM